MKLRIKKVEDSTFIIMQNVGDEADPMWTFMGKSKRFSPWIDPREFKTEEGARNFIRREFPHATTV
jgi:hypothetical protein